MAALARAEANSETMKRGEVDERAGRTCSESRPLYVNSA